MRNSKNNQLLKELAKKGRGGDTELAHVNPLEAMMLERSGGSGTINPKTGLREYKGGGLFNKPGKWLRGSLGGGAGAILGNMAFPGAGGVVGGALGGALGSKMRGRKDYGQAAMRGGMMGLAAPSLAGAGGWAANSLGQTGLGATLSDYSTTNAILPSLGFGGGATAAGGAGGVGAATGGMGVGGTAAGAGLEGGASYLNPMLEAEIANGGVSAPANLSFADKLMANSKEFLSDPKNLMATGAAAAGLYAKSQQKKPLTPAQRAKEDKEAYFASMMTPEEMARKEAYDLEMMRGQRRNARRKYVKEERIDVKPLYNRVSSPEEQANTGTWFNYYDNPEFTGKRLKR